MLEWLSINIGQSVLLIDKKGVNPWATRSVEYGGVDLNLLNASSIPSFLHSCSMLFGLIQGVEAERNHDKES